MTNADPLINQAYVRGPFFATCITTTVFTVLFVLFFLITLSTWIVQTYVFNIYQLEIPFVWIGYSEDAVLDVWVQTYQRFCTNLLIIYYVLFFIVAVITTGLVLMYLTAQTPSSKDRSSFWAVVLQRNYNVLFRCYWTVVYPVQVDLVLVIFGATDIQFLVITLLLALAAVVMYNLADWRMSKPISEAGSTICMDFNCCTITSKEGRVPFYALIEFWVFFLLALVYMVLLFVLALVYTVTAADNHFYYLWAVFAFELIQVITITTLLIGRNFFLRFFAIDNLQLASDVALLFTNSVVFLLNALVVCIVSWARIAYIGCGNGCATSCP